MAIKQSCAGGAATYVGVSSFDNSVERFSKYLDSHLIKPL